MSDRSQQTADRHARRSAAPTTFANVAAQMIFVALAIWVATNLAVYLDFKSLINFLWIIGIPLGVNFVSHKARKIDFPILALLYLISFIIFAMVAAGDLMYYNL